MIFYLSGFAYFFCSFSIYACVLIKALRNLTPQCICIFESAFWLKHNRVIDVQRRCDARWYTKQCHARWRPYTQMSERANGCKNVWFCECAMHRIEHKGFYEVNWTKLSADIGDGFCVCAFSQKLQTLQKNRKKIGMESLFQQRKREKKAKWENVMHNWYP